MRPAVVLLLLVGCGRAAVTPVAPVAPIAPVAPRPMRPVLRAPAADVITRLAPGPDSRVSWLAPGAIELEGGAATFDAVTAAPLQVSIVERLGAHVRVAVRLPHAWFAAWTDRRQLFAVIRERAVVAPAPGQLRAGATEAALQPGARVARVAHAPGWTQVRYDGQVEIEGWVPDAALGEDVLVTALRRAPSTRSRRVVLAGTVLRAEASPTGWPVAVIATARLIEVRGEDAGGWITGVYRDADVDVVGRYLPRAPLAPLRRARVEPDSPPVPVVPTATVATGTCLHARIGGEPIGFVFGDRAVGLTELGAGWWTLTLDSPWGGLPFVVRGRSAAELATCAPLTGR